MLFAEKYARCGEGGSLRGNVATDLWQPPNTPQRRERTKEGTVGPAWNTGKSTGRMERRAGCFDRQPPPFLFAQVLADQFPIASTCVNYCPTLQNGM
jgi:hypothetical protein